MLLPQLDGHENIKYCSFFSATWPSDVRRLAQSYMKNPFQVCVGSLDLRVSVLVVTDC